MRRTPGSSSTSPTSAGRRSTRPTASCRTDHVRVAYGRHYRDTAPTAGTLYTGANETLHIDVEVKDIAARESVSRDAQRSAPSRALPSGRG